MIPSATDHQTEGLSALENSYRDQCEDCGAVYGKIHHCRDCHRWWSGTTQAHCMKCHRHFANHPAFSLHLRGVDPVIHLDPATMFTKGGVPRMELRGDKYGPTWRKFSLPMDDKALAARSGESK